jgi:hypothetical protein
MADDEHEAEVKEVYARFGLALYFAQVLEHGIVNAMVIMSLIPEKRHLAPSASEWAATVDQFMSQKFEKTMGGLIHDLQAHGATPAGLQGSLRDALRKRNWLAHHFFRERASDFMTRSGRSRMLAELDECRDLFHATDSLLEQAVRPVRLTAGLSDEMLADILEKMRAELDDAG